MTVMSPAGASGHHRGPLRMTPGRWAALAVAVPVALALIGLTGFSLVSSWPGEATRSATPCRCRTAGWR